MLRLVDCHVGAEEPQGKHLAERVLSWPHRSELGNMTSRPLDEAVWRMCPTDAREAEFVDYANAVNVFVAVHVNLIPGIVSLSPSALGRLHGGNLEILRVEGAVRIFSRCQSFNKWSYSHSNTRI